MTAIATALLSAVSIDAAFQMIDAAFRHARLELPGELGLRMALGVVMSQPPEQTGAAGPATLATARQNMLRRAQFVLASARRLSAAARGGENLRAALETERRYYGLHLQALWNRARGASQVDSAAQSYGDLLGWYTVLDRRTSAECRAASGRNFSVMAQPLIGWPGTVHPHCRCYPGRPHRGARMLASAGVPARMVKVA